MQIGYEEPGAEEHLERVDHMQEGERRIQTDGRTVGREMFVDETENREIELVERSERR